MAAIVSHRKILNAAIFTMRLFGLWSPPHRHSSRVSKLFHSFYNIVVLSVLYIFAITLIADLCLSYRDLTIVTDDGCFIAGITVIIFKLLNFRSHSKRIENLIAAIHDPVETLQRSSDRAVVRLLENFVWHEKITVYCFSSLCVFLVAALILYVPITTKQNGSLPFRAKYPFDTSVHPMHGIALVIQGSAVTTGLVAIMTMDIIVLGFCRYTQLQLEILTSNYANCHRNYTSNRDSRDIRDSKFDIGKRTALTATSLLLPEQEKSAIIRSFVPFEMGEIRTDRDTADHDDDETFIKRFTTCVKHHQRLIGNVDEMNRLFSSSMLVQLCASLSMICLSGFQIAVGTNDGATIIKFLLYLGAAFTQLLCWCWYGNKLKYQSDYLAVGQWSSGWENERDFSSMTFLMIISLIRTRRSMHLRAGSFYTMSMETFIAILRASYSFFALLTTVNECTEDRCDD